MKNKLVLGLCIGFLLGVVLPHVIFCQTEKLDIIEYTPPTGWTKTLKQGTTIYVGSNKTAGTFCILTIYPSTASSGTPQGDFATEWNELIVKPFKAAPDPKTETQTSDGWTSVSAAAEIESDGSKSAVLVTVVSGYGRKATVFAIFNGQEYFPQIDAFITSIKMDKAVAQGNADRPSAQTSPPTTAKNGDYLDFDPFPGFPGFQPPKPLLGRLRKTITMADLVGKWELGGASVTSYYNSSSGNYSGTDTSFYREDYVIRPDGTYESKFQGRASNQTIREADSGTIVLDGGLIIIKSKLHPAMRNQFVAFMEQADGAAILSLLFIGDKPAYTGEQIRGNCSHTQGYISCIGGNEWVRLPK